MTERLWLTEPRRSTCIAKVTQVKGRAFTLDRSLFAPASKLHRHPQPGDKGTTWEQGEKRRLSRSFLRDGFLWHELMGTVPTVGASLQCHLDTDRRLEASRAHAAMHLLLAALHRGNGPALTADPEVKGGGTFRIDLDAAVAPATLAAWVAQANQWVKEDLKVLREHVVRTAATQVLDAQRFVPTDAFPGPANVLDAWRIEGVCAYPCDGTLVDATRKVGRIVLAQANARRGGMTLVGKVVDA